MIGCGPCNIKSYLGAVVVRTASAAVVMSMVSGEHQSADPLPQMRDLADALVGGGVATQFP